ncbi:uncharacterized protein N7458_007327 [Penicillium daleae]|uniref:Major facilitator superfamily (MFS) profile domain-containing protein n=1 Tax=Penicillium daleae TaxID=63821 RepID=A0AAD6G0Z6_9EURO|nr:uncharacterized protein N7458_007327 [Penicillium daleae]KAJ5443455.1 hypothetical protein N7458_007327 [Penicillium daleae]
MGPGSIRKEYVEIVENIPKPSHVTEIDTFRVVDSTTDDEQFYTTFSDERRKKVFRKADLRLVPMLALLYLICHIDRANIGNAKIGGIVQGLGMTGVQYNTVLSSASSSITIFGRFSKNVVDWLMFVIFFTTYVFFEVPSKTSFLRSLSALLPTSAF